MKFILTIFIALFSDLLLGQEINIGSSSLPYQANAAVANVQRNLGESISIYNGREHVPYNHKIKGSPYFMGSGIHKGRLKYDGTLYEEVRLMFDKVSGKIIMVYPNGAFEVELVQDLADHFILEGHQFVKLAGADTLPSFLSGKTFYDLLYDGPSKLYCQYVSFIIDDNSNGSLRQEYSDKTYYFLYFNKKYYKIKNQQALYKLFKIHKKEIKKTLITKNLSIKTNKEAAYKEMVRQFDQLSQHEE